MKPWGPRLPRSPAAIVSSPLRVCRRRIHVAASTHRLPSQHRLRPAVPRRARPPFHPVRPAHRLVTFGENFQPSVMTTMVKLATVPSADTPGLCVLFHHQKRSYLFGRIAEGTQRALSTRKIGWSSAEHVFLSGAVDWEQMAGLFGVLLTTGGLIEDSKANKERLDSERTAKGLKPKYMTVREGIDVHGGDNLCHVLAASRHAIYRQPVRVRTHETRQDPRAVEPGNLAPDWEDDAVKVWKIPMRRARSSSPQKRRHHDPQGAGGGADDADETLPKPRHTVSDPETASVIVEKAVFGGKLVKSVLVPRKISQVKPTDVAFVVRGLGMERYRGPFATEVAELENPDGVVHVLPDQTEEAVEAGDDAVGDDSDIRSLRLPPTAYSETSMSYIVKCHSRRGKFNAPLAKSLGVLGADFKLLATGQTVTTKDGTVVTPGMVLGEEQPGNGIIVADIPSRDFLDAFLARPEWSSIELMSHIIAMYWSLAPGLAEDPRIQQFTKDHAQFKHVFCAPDTCPNMISHTSAAETQVKLRCIDPERFPLPKFDNTVKYPAPPAGSPIELGRVGGQVSIMPRVLFEDQAVAPFPDLLTPAKSMGEEVLALARKAKLEATDPEFLARIEEEEKDIPNRDAEIIPLGTGSSVPSQYRNVSGTLVRVPGVGNYLLDCGEGTMGQMRRFFDAEQTEDVLRNLRCIAISHLHADHHMGTPTLIKAWYEQALKDGRNDATLAISCNLAYKHFLGEVSQVQDMGIHRLRFPHSRGRSAERLEAKREDLAGADGDCFGLASITRVPVKHCWRSHAVQLELESGLRIAYSGDCRPSAAFAERCRGAHLLVHECTFGDDMAAHARSKQHSSMSEALGVARAMAARRTLLTHFSQRYPKARPLRGDEDKEKLGPVLLAFDLMRVRLGEFRQAGCYIPAIDRLLENADEEQAV